MPNVKTITLTGGEVAVTFENSYPYYFITNMDDGEVYASGNPGIVPYADGVYTVPTGVETRISPERSGNTVYLLGSGKVQVRAETIAVPTSFKRTAKGGERIYEFGKNFGSHNLLADYAVNSDICTKTQDGEAVTYTIAANKASRWYFLASLISVTRGKMYKLTVDKFAGYGRLAISSYNNGGDNPYGSGSIGDHFNRNTAGNFTDDNKLITSDDINTKYFYVVNSSSADEIEIGIWICTDVNRDGANGTNAHSFDIGLYEEI